MAAKELVEYVAKALRTLLKVTAARDGEPVQLEIV